MTSWANECLDETEAKGIVEPPNKDAPRMVKKVTKQYEEEKRKIEYTTFSMKIDSVVHQQLQRIVLFERLNGNGDANMKDIFIRGMEMYLKKNKLPSLNELGKGTTISEDMFK